jgi:hypothetical protein
MLLKNSLSVIGRNKELLVFPIVVFVCTAAIILFFCAPLVLRPTGYSYASAQHWEAISHSLFQSSPGAAGQSGDQVVFSRAAMVYMAFLYFLAMFIATFFNVAFYHEILAALSGQPVAIGRGIKFAFTKLGSIVMWTVFAGLVGLIIKTIEERLQLVGRIVGRLIGIAWSVASVFAIPVIVRQEQNANPVAVLQKSAGVLKRTWGEALIGYAGLAFANTVILICSIVALVGVSVLSAALNNYWIIALVFLAWLGAMFCWSYLTSVAGHVYRGALYLYAAEGVVSEPYTQDMFDMAWKFKKS